MNRSAFNSFNSACVYVFVTLSILQSQFTEKGFKKTENSKQNVVLLLFLFTLESRLCLLLNLPKQRRYIYF